MIDNAKKLDFLLETKEQIKEAISNQKVDISEDEPFRNYADKIYEIKGDVFQHYGTQLFRLTGIQTATMGDASIY